jgi:hypothetical protein
MWLFRFLFTGRRAFVVFALAAFSATLAYMAWYHRYREPLILQQRSAERLRQMHRGADDAIRNYKGPVVAPPAVTKREKEVRP